MNSNNSEKYAILTDLAKKISALDNPVKLNILSSLTESGSLSITDVAKKLNINFSTAHKYLEQLEEAGFVKSRQVSENRLKRIFTIQNFAIELSPRSLFQTSSDANSKDKAKFKIFDSHGQLVDFDEEKFAQKYIKRGMPRGTFLLAMQEILPQVYDGITLLELHKLLRQTLENKANSIAKVFKQLDEDENHKRTFQHHLSITYPKALELHTNGTIFIRNLQKPFLFNFIHDVKSLSLHGLGNTVSRSCEEFLKQLLFAITNVNFSEGTQTLADFSSVLAEFSGVTNKILEQFFETLSQTNKKFLIEIDMTTAKQSNSKVVINKLIDILTKNKYTNIVPVFKITNIKALPQEIKALKEFYIVNADSDVSISEYIVSKKQEGKFRTARTGEAQEIVINLPKIATESKSKGNFKQQVLEIIKLCIEFHLNMMELTLGKFIREYSIRLPSVIQGYWSYVIPSNLIYSISLANLWEAVEIVGMSKRETISLLQTLQKLMKQAIDNHFIRLVLKENCDNTVSKRFARFVKQPIETKLVEYSPHTLNVLKFFNGGSFRTIQNKDLTKYLKNNMSEVLHVISFD